MRAESGNRVIGESSNSIAQFLNRPINYPITRLPDYPTIRCPDLLLAEVANDPLERVDDFVAAGAALGEAQFEIERLGRRAVGEHVVLRPARRGLAGRLAELLAGRRTALAGHLLDERGHFFGGV